jgi:drug/metabolite transporter superfamily protein YnfA
MTTQGYLFIADVLLITHVLFVAFVVGGLLAIIAGGLLSWPWVRNPWFRLAHLLSIAVVVVQSWAGIICPLTTLEMAVRARANGATYGGAFISHWLDKLLYYQLPEWVFVVVYSTFGALVLLTWYGVRPRPFGSRGQRNKS